MNVKSILKKISDLESKLNDYFDGMIYEVIRDMTDQYWTVFNEHEEKDENGKIKPFTRANSVGWSDSNPIKDNPDDPDREHVYGDDVQSVVRKDKYTLICIRTSTGDGKEDLIFDNSKEITECDLNP